MSINLGLRERNKIDKCYRIKMAALDLFISNGYEKTTMRAIAATAGVGIGTVFMYADCKRDLLFLVVNDDLENCVERAFECVHGRSFLSDIIEPMRVHYEYFSRVPVISRQVLTETYFYRSGKQLDRFRRTRDRFAGLIANTVERAIGDHLIDPAETTELVGRILFDIYQVEIRRWLVEEKLDIESGITLLSRQIKVVIQGLNPSPSTMR